MKIISFSSPLVMITWAEFRYMLRNVPKGYIIKLIKQTKAIHSESELYKMTKPMLIDLLFERYEEVV